MGAKTSKTTMAIAVAIGVVLLLCGGRVCLSKPKKQAAPAAAAPPYEVPEWVRTIAALRERPDHIAPTSVDRSGDKVIISYYEVAPWSRAYAAQFKSNPSAWKFQVEGDVPKCDATALGPNVEELKSSSCKPFEPSWHRIHGGALADLVVKRFCSSPCMLHIGTSEYWREQGEAVPEKP